MSKNNDNEGMLVSRGFLARVDAMLKVFEARQLNEQPTWQAGLGGIYTPKHVVYTSDLSIPADYENETTATATLWGGNGDLFADQEFPITVTNRNPNFAAFEDDFGMVIQESGEWRPLPVPSTLRLGKTDSTILKGAQGNVSLHSGTVLGSEPDTGTTVNCYNRFADIDGSKWVFIDIVDGYWTLVSGECA